MFCFCGGSFSVWIIHFSLSHLFYLQVGVVMVVRLESSCIQVSRVYANVKKMKFHVTMVIQSHRNS